MTDDSNSKPELGERKVRGTVAPGRTVAIPHATDRRVVSYTTEGEAIEQAPLVHFGPGQEVVLPSKEIATLRRLGYVVDPNQSAAPIGPGPNFSQAA